MVLLLQAGGDFLLQITYSPKVGEFTLLVAMMRSMVTVIPGVPALHSGAMAAAVNGHCL
jgi:hypothetical protein